MLSPKITDLKDVILVGSSASHCLEKWREWGSTVSHGGLKWAEYSIQGYST